MPKQLKQTQGRTSDINQIAHHLVERSTNEQGVSSLVPQSISDYMAQIGRKGGEIGGKRRLKTMTREERSRVARKAARARWNKAKVAH